VRFSLPPDYSSKFHAELPIPIACGQGLRIALGTAIGFFRAVRPTTPPTRAVRPTTTSNTPHRRRHAPAPSICSKRAASTARGGDAIAARPATFRLFKSYSGHACRPQGGLLAIMDAGLAQSQCTRPMPSLSRRVVPTDPRACGAPPLSARDGRDRAPCFETGVVTPVFFGTSGSVYFHVAGGIEVAGRAVSRVAQILDVYLVSGVTGGGNALGNGSVGVAVAAA
jgi:hypothetical protein